MLNTGHLGRSGSLVLLFSTPLMNRQMFEVVVYYVHYLPIYPISIPLQTGLMFHVLSQRMIMLNFCSSTICVLCVG